MQKRLKKILCISIIVISLLFPGCKNSAKNHPVDFIDRKAVLQPSEKPNPLILIVEITEDGKLSLNHIETGMIDDVALLSEKIKVIFDDREKTSIREKEVVIDPRGMIKKEDLEKLIQSLIGVKASPIRVIKNSFQENNL